MGDPRVDGARLSSLSEILAQSVLVALCGADSFRAIELFGRLNQKRLRTFPDPPHGIPSRDTIERVFARLGRGQFEAGTHRWVCRAVTVSEGQVFAIDGQAVRRSHDRA